LLSLQVDLFNKLFFALRPGGILFIVDYCCKDEGIETCSSTFRSYFQPRGIELCSAAQYKADVAEAGFQIVEDSDETRKLKLCTEEELKKLSEGKDNFVKTFGDSNYKEMHGLWKSKAKWITHSKDLKLVKIVACKPLGAMPPGSPR